MAMPSTAEALIARLQADCTAAEANERTVRARVDAQIKAAATERAFAWRRLNALSDMARAASLESECEASIERQLVALFREIGWVENDLSELGDGAKPLIDQLRPIAEALHAEIHPDPPEEKEEGAAPRADPIAAFRAFETWYERERGEPFLQAFERWTPPTPLVEF